MLLMLDLQPHYKTQELLKSLEILLLLLFLLMVLVMYHLPQQFNQIQLLLVLIQLVTTFSQLLELQIRLV